MVVTLLFRELLINYFSVIPAKAGTQSLAEIYELDSGSPLRSGRNDGLIRGSLVLSLRWVELNTQNSRPILSIQAANHEGGKLANNYPDPTDAGIKIPSHVKAAAFCAGFRHGLKGGQLDKAKYMRLSFREGFRASRLFLRKHRREHGIIDFPARWKVRLKAVV